MATLRSFPVAAALSLITLLITFFGPTGVLAAPQVNAATLDLVKHFEGHHRSVYRDPTGKPTIGYGHLCQRAGCSEIGYPIPLSAANMDRLLRTDLGRFERCVAGHVPKSVVNNPNLYGAIVSWGFNVGCGAVGSSTLIRRIKAGNDPLTVVTQELPRWNKGGGRVLSGLTRRRKAEIALAKKAPPAAPAPSPTTTTSSSSSTSSSVSSSSTESSSAGQSGVFPGPVPDPTGFPGPEPTSDDGEQPAPDDDFTGFPTTTQPESEPTSEPEPADPTASATVPAPDSDGDDGEDGDDDDAEDGSDADDGEDGEDADDGDDAGDGNDDEEGGDADENPDPAATPAPETPVPGSSSDTVIPAAYNPFSPDYQPVVANVPIPGPAAAPAPGSQGESPQQIPSSPSSSSSSSSSSAPNSQTTEQPARHTVRISFTRLTSFRTFTRTITVPRSTPSATPTSTP